jgi:hypothetical protein
MINQISEIFRIARHNALKDHQYFYTFNSKEIRYHPLGFKEPIVFESDRVLHIQDPTDFICADGIESLKQILGCNA